MLSVVDFYDALAPWYHLVYQDWEASIARQGEALGSLPTTEWGKGVRRLLDVTVGVGTQALGLAAPTSAPSQHGRHRPMLSLPATTRCLTSFLRTRFESG